MITYGQIVKALAGALRHVARVEAYDQISESIVETPTIHVYAESAEVDSAGDTDRSSLSGAVRVTTIIINADGYARQRSHLAQDLRAQMDLIDRIDEALLRSRPPFYGLPDIKAVSWGWERATLAHGDPATEYAGVRFTIEITVF